MMSLSAVFKLPKYSTQSEKDKQVRFFVLFILTKALRKYLYPNDRLLEKN